MSSNDKLGLGFEIQSNDEVLSVPPPLSGDYTPKPQEEIDDTLYVYGKKGPQKPEISVSDENSSEHSSCQSNNSEGSCENISVHSFETESESKMAREAEVKRVVNTGNGVAKPVWTNANRVNHANQFVPRSVQLNAGRSKFNSVRPNINTGRTNINSGRPKVNAVSPKVNTVSPKVNNVRPRQPVLNKTSNSSSPKRPQMNQRRDFSKSYSSARRPFAKSTAQMAHSNVVMGNWESVGHQTGTRSNGGLKKSMEDLFTLEVAKATILVKKDKGCWVFFLASKDETSGILQNFIRQIENQLSHRVKIIRSDNGTEFKNRYMLEFCGNKGIKQEYNNARTPQQNGVAERMNGTLIEAARTMLADSLLPTTFWAEAVSTACYIFNRVRVTKPQNKTPYELLFGHKPIISYIRPLGYHVTILDTLSVLGKFDGKASWY
ncbi:putative ribonuclease H-like domain-containing protein [Tanacetum coccineum]